MIEKEAQQKITKETSKEELLKEGNISLIIDSYNDLFSSFDPRAYSERALSDDFLIESKKAVRDKREDELGAELRILIPKLKRNLNDETKIKKRLRSHFQKHYIEKQNEIKKIRIEGVIWFIIGIVFILFATFFYNQKGFVFNLLFVLFEPAGWFTMWSGLDKIFLNVKEKEPELRFYKKMTKLQINFSGY